MSAPPAPRHPVPNHIPVELREAFATTAGRAIPPHSPYQPGDAVQRHGYGGNPPGPRQTGFRGWAVATVGATILTGITTSGEEWWEEWGFLHPAGEPVDMWDHCVCCREERRVLLREHHARQRARGAQLGLFEVNR
ncbi:hypothetical protein [Streptomyces sp. URMC 129]|uniref:hypothetical protein n=1 Tax=Streptomyces sp. URMC 129 TaxID=3423407 RepID=UPI003F19B007